MVPAQDLAWRPSHAAATVTSMQIMWFEYGLYKYLQMDW
jgi:hypothetical protein